MSAHRRAALEKALGAHGVAVRTVTGTSMMPTLNPGEKVFVEPCRELKAGDIVAFALGEGLFVHRVLRVDSGRVICRGDNRQVADPPVRREDILGKVVQVVGRERVPDRRIDVARVSLRLARLRAGLRLRHLLGEIRLFAAQAGLGEAPPYAPALPTLWDETDPEVRPECLLTLPAGTDPDSLAAAMPAGDPVVIPAGVFSRLPASARRELLLRLSGRTVIVWAVSMESAGRVARLFTALRRVALRAGVSVGAPGDVYVAAGLAGPGGRAHVSTADELRRLILEAGGGDVAVESRSVRGAALLRAKARLVEVPPAGHDARASARVPTGA